MDFTQISNEMVSTEIEQYGCDAFKKHYNHDRYAHKSGYQKFLESGSRFWNRPLPERPSGRVKIIRSYPESYIEAYNRAHS